MGAVKNFKTHFFLAESWECQMYYDLPNNNIGYTIGTK